MTVYVDPLIDWGMKYRGRTVQTCHMVTDTVDLTELHNMASRLGLGRYFQDKPGYPHYDLMPTKRAEAVRFGAVEIDGRELVAVLRKRREAMAE